MNYSVIKPFSIENGYGCRVSIFVSGCEKKCKGCFNPETWDFNYGQPFGEKDMETLLSDLRPDYIQGLTILGGEPLHPRNVDKVAEIVKRVREMYGGDKDIWVYTGYTLDEVSSRCAGILKQIDVLVDGAFEEDKKDLMLSFRGSSNQNIIEL